MASMQPEDAPRSREQAKQWKKERKLQAQRKAKETASATAEAKAARRPSPPPSVQLSKALAYILRHGAEKEHLPVRPDGFIQVDAVLARPRVQKVPMMEEDTVRAPTLEDIQAIVRDNDKKRFELVEGAANSPTEPGTCWWIRAVQGHSLDQITDLSHIPLTVENVSSHLQALLPTSTSCQAIHGTNDEAWTQIEASQALRRMQRNHIHLAKGVPGSSGVISGTYHSPLPQACAPPAHVCSTSMSAERWRMACHS
ncbi:tRNA 2'-phosphotransferase [Malassezia pachydermatis]